MTLGVYYIVYYYYILLYLLYIILLLYLILYYTLLFFHSPPSFLSSVPIFHLLPFLLLCSHLPSPSIPSPLPNPFPPLIYLPLLLSHPSLSHLSPVLLTFLPPNIPFPTFFPSPYLPLPSFFLFPSSIILIQSIRVGIYCWILISPGWLRCDVFNSWNPFGWLRCVGLMSIRFCFEFWCFADIPVF